LHRPVSLQVVHLFLAARADERLRDLVVVAIQGYFENGDVVLARVDINLVVGIFVVALGVVLLAQEHVVGVDVCVVVAKYMEPVSTSSTE